MFGTMGFSELILILAIVFVIFGAGRLPQLGEGIGKALRSFKKEVHDTPEPPQAAVSAAEVQPAPPAAETNQSSTVTGPSSAVKPRPAYIPGPELTPGTTASMLYHAGPQPPPPPRTTPHGDPQATVAQAQHVVSLEERASDPAPLARAQYPPQPATSSTRPVAKRPSAIVNREAVARVQAQQAALKARSAPVSEGISPDEMQRVGESMGDALRTFRKAVDDVRHTVEPQMRTIQAEMDAAHKELRQSLEAGTKPSAAPESSKS